MGYTRADYAGKPVIAILNTWSDINPCHSHFRAARRGGEARRLAGGRLPGRDAGDLARRSRSRSRPRCSTATCSRWRPRSCCAATRSTARADGRLRQDHARRCIMGALSMNLPAIFMPAGPMLRGDFARRAPRLRQRRLEVLGGAARGQHHRGGLAGRRGRHRALARALHDDGHRLDDDQRGGGAGLHAAGCRLDPRARLAPRADGHAHGPAHRRDGVGGPEAVATSSTRARSTMR